MIELQAGGACYSWRLAPLRRLGGLWTPFEARVKVVHGSGEGIVKGVVLAPRETRRATLVDQGAKSAK